MTKVEFLDIVEKINWDKFNSNLFLSNCICRDHTIGELITELIIDNLLENK